MTSIHIARDTAAVEDAAAKPPASLKIKLAFGGGVEVLFDNVRSTVIDLPAVTPPPKPRPADLRYLISWMVEHILTDRKELFIDGDTVRPGILVLVNDTDWELEGELDYELKEGDEVVFISTLHGG